MRHGNPSVQESESPFNATSTGEVQEAAAAKSALARGGPLPYDAASASARRDVMNVAFLVKRYETGGGTERNLYELTRHFVSFGHQVHVYCLAVRRTPEAGLVVHRIPWLGVGRTANLLRIGVLAPRMAARAGHDVVISFVRAVRQDIVRNGGGTHKAFLEQIRAADSAGKRLIRALDPYHRLLLAIERQQFRKGHYRRIVANAQGGKTAIMDSYAVPEGAVQVIYNGVDTLVFNPVNAARGRAAMRKRFGLPEDAPVIIFVGNGYKRKGLDFLLQALARVKAERVYCLVVGAEPALSVYESRVRDLGLVEQVRFAGFQRELTPLYGAADFFVLPSLYDPFGHSTLEALACGLPAVGARQTGASELLHGDLATLTVEDPTDIGALEERIRRLLDPVWRGTLSGQAAAIGRSHSLEANARAFEELCEEVLAEEQTLPGGRAGTLA